MLTVIDGAIKDTRIEARIYRNLEHVQMAGVCGIVLYQTSSASTFKTLAEYRLG